uniref:Putative E3 ubiquitin-protein ligase UBR7 (inferred by orthology to a human protein) n=1 Tax=Anisakis simplex TaxID=6269 RepID=A0A0M3JC52_ANISI
LKFFIGIFSHSSIFKGYPPRQMIYTCATCFPTMKRDLTTLEPLPTAICYGCSMNCHSGHTLLELYTKRRVCCDCGNSKFRHPCQLYPGKKLLNTWNQYNHNYEGRYCACDRPYADSVPLYGYDEIWEEGGVMVQCIVCEDWFHVNVGFVFNYFLGNLFVGCVQ